MIGVGDLVVCVDAGPPRFPRRRVGLRLEEGRIYRVSAAFMRLSFLHVLVDGEPCHVDTDGSRKGWDAERFRKIQHDKREACESEFQTLLNRTKKEVSA